MKFFCLFHSHKMHLLAIHRPQSDERLPNPFICIFIHLVKLSKSLPIFIYLKPKIGTSYKQMYSYGRCSQYFKNYFVFNEDICARLTRQSDLLHLPAIRTEVAKKSFYYHGSMVFDSCCKCP